MRGLAETKARNGRGQARRNATAPRDEIRLEAPGRCAIETADAPGKFVRNSRAAAVPTARGPLRFVGLHRSGHHGPAHATSGAASAFVNVQVEVTAAIPDDPAHLDEFWAAAETAKPL